MTGRPFLRVQSVLPSSEAHVCLLLLPLSILWIRLPAVSDNLDECLEVLVKGFDRVIAAIPVPPVAISFAFPGPADYENGIIGDLPNFPSFRGGVALGPFLKHKYGIPVFIENDGNLFAYGEALSGALPMINRELSLAGCSREYKNLIGITLGTGFGAGVVINKVLLTGDNGCGGDIWLMRNKKYPDMLAEESVSIRAVRRVYSDLSGQSSASLSPKDIYDHPENLFVAGFIGSPQMNLLDAICKVKDGEAYLEVGNNKINLPKEKSEKLIKGNYADKKIVMGIRPEDIYDRKSLESDVDKVMLHAKVSDMEMLGAETFLYFDINGNSITARVDPKTTIKTGDTAEIALDIHKIHLFDKETSKTIIN